MPDTVSDDCEYRSNYNMWVCPPFSGSYRQLQIRIRRQFSHGNWPGQVYAQWECNKAIETKSRGNGGSFEFSLKTNKLYNIDFSPHNTDPPTGLAFIPTSSKFEGVYLTLSYPGTWSFEYYYLYTSANGFWGNWVRDYNNITSECRCNVTYVRIWVWNPFDGVELRANRNASVTCPTSSCGTPYPIPSPQGYSCDQNLQSNNKNTTTCTMTSPPTATVTPPTRPNLPTFPKPTIPAAYSGNGNPSLSCSGASTISLSNTGSNTVSDPHTETSQWPTTDEHWPDTTTAITVTTQPVVTTMESSSAISSKKFKFF